jgi:DNA-binding HxlR family transcriptional regulator
MEKLTEAKQIQDAKDINYFFDNIGTRYNLKVLYSVLQQPNNPNELQRLTDTDDKGREMGESYKYLVEEGYLTKEVSFSKIKGTRFIYTITLLGITYKLFIEQLILFSSEQRARTMKKRNDKINGKG